MHVANIIKWESLICSDIELYDEELKHVKEVADSISPECKNFVMDRLLNEGFDTPDFIELLLAKCDYHPLIYRGLEPGRRIHEFWASIQAGVCPDGGFQPVDFENEFSESFIPDKVNIIWGVTSNMGNVDASRCDEAPPLDNCGYRAVSILMASAYRWVTFVIAGRA